MILFSVHINIFRPADNNKNKFSLLSQPGFGLLSQTVYLSYFRIWIRYSMATAILSMALMADGQDVHFAGVQDMNIWYNPALKTNKLSLLHANFRSVNYQGITAYSSKSGTIELPLSSHDKSENNIGYANLAAGINTDNASNQTLDVSTGMMSLSYALPLNNNNTYLALGFQGTYTFSKVAFSAALPNRFDQYGALGAAVTSDPVQSGYEYDYFNAGAGVALFHTSVEKQWYIGASLRHINQPYTDWTYAARLPMNRGIQAGYTTIITNEDIIGGYGYFSWQGAVHEQVIGALYTRNLDDSSRYAFSLGLGFRVGDALIPNLALKIGDNRLSFYYEFNVFGNSFINYNRTAFEFSYALIL